MHRAPGREQAEHVAPRVLSTASARDVDLDYVSASLKRDAFGAAQEVGQVVHECWLGNLNSEIAAVVNATAEKGIGASAGRPLPRLRRARPGAPRRVT